MPVRPFVQEDMPFLKEILEATDVFRSEEIDVAIELMEAVIDEPDLKDYVMYTYVDDSNAVRGYYCIGPTPMTSGSFDLYWLATDPRVHGNGIGKQLLEHCEALVKSQHGRLIIAETSSQPKYNKTHLFYLRRGYEEAARIRDYYSCGDDLVIYVKHLEEAR